MNGHKFDWVLKLMLTLYQAQFHGKLSLNFHDGHPSRKVEKTEHLTIPE